MIKRVPFACPAKTPRRGVSPRQATLAAPRAPRPAASLRLPPDRMRAATTDHGQTIHLLRKTSLANSTQLPDECSVRDAMAGAGRHQTECDRAVAFARVIGNECDERGRALRAPGF